MSAHDSHSHHITSAKTLWSVGIALIILTIVTVAVSALGLPQQIAILAALTIALSKAYLVAAYFMGLKWDTKFNTLLLLGAVAFFILMVSVTLLDTMFRDDAIPSF